MKNIIIDINEVKSSSEQNDDLGELLLPKKSEKFFAETSFEITRNEPVLVLKGSIEFLDFILIHSKEALWKMEILYRSKGSPLTRHAFLSCLDENKFTLKVSGRVFAFSKAEEALAHLLQGDQQVGDGKEKEKKEAETKNSASVSINPTRPPRS